MLASVSDGGGPALTLTLNANESLAIVASGSTYVFSTNQTFTNGGIASAGDFSAFGGTSLTLNAPGLNRYVLVNIIDAGTNASVTFNSSGASNYHDTFFVALDNAAGPITFNGTTALAGFASLSVSTTSSVVLSSGSSVTVAGGDLTLSSAGSNTDLTVSGSVRSESGNIDLTATRHVTLATGAVVNSGAGALTLGADVMVAGAGDDGSGTLTIQTGVSVYGAKITLRGADVEIADTATVGSAVVGNLGLAGTLTGLNSPWPLAVDSNDNLYVGNQASTTVSRFALGATTPSATLTGQVGPWALAFDSGGNLYVANYNSGSGTTVSRFAPGATTANSTLTGLSFPYALAFDSSSNLYVANGLGDTVSKFLPGATTASTTLTGLVNPFALVFDSGGTLYVANYGDGTVSKFALTAVTTLTVRLEPSLAGRPVSVGANTAGSLGLTNAELDQTPPRRCASAPPPAAPLPSVPILRARRRPPSNWPVAARLRSLRDR